MWADIKPAYKECQKYLESSDFTEPADFEAAESKYEATFNSYVNCLASINEKIADLKHKASLKTSSSEVTPPSNDNFGHNLVLPPCDIDDFAGDFVSWPTFRDLFTAIFINNLRLSNIERLCHLLKRTKGEARAIVSNCPFTNDGFDIAWKNLIDTYENPRMVVNDQLKTLFSLPFLREETSSGLKSLQRSISNCLSTMSNYNISTDSWDPILVFICLQRLPSLTVNLWEQSLRDKSALSLWRDLDIFITDRTLTLDCVCDLRRSEHPQRSFEKHIKSHNLHSNSSSFNHLSDNNHSLPIPAKSFCPLCRNQVHNLRTCLRFRQQSVSDRFSLVTKHNYCLNCLSVSHLVNDCGSKYNCTICNKRHHTLIHRESSTSIPSAIDLNSLHTGASLSSVPRTNNSTQLNYSLPRISTDHDNAAANITNGNSSAGPSNRQVFHTYHNKSVILGTAMVNLYHMGTTYTARALIDPGSEATFISESLQERMKLRTHFTNVRVSGVNRAISATTKKLCSIHLGSSLNPSKILTTMALVLPSISGTLPSFTVPTSVKETLPNLKLADEKCFDHRPIDILIGADLYPQILLEGVRQNIFGSLLAQNTIFGWILTGPIEQPAVQVYSVNLNHSTQLTNNLIKRNKRRKHRNSKRDIRGNDIVEICHVHSEHTRTTDIRTENGVVKRPNLTKGRFLRVPLGPVT